MIQSNNPSAKVLLPPDCVICQDPMLDGEEIRIHHPKAKVQHAFHRACIEQWTKRGHNNCPTCRQELGEDERSREYQQERILSMIDFNNPSTQQVIKQLEDMVKKGSFTDQSVLLAAAKVTNSEIVMSMLQSRPHISDYIRGDLLYTFVEQRKPIAAVEFLLHTGNILMSDLGRALLAVPEKIDSDDIFQLLFRSGKITEIDMSRIMASSLYVNNDKRVRTVLDTMVSSNRNVGCISEVVRWAITRGASKYFSFLVRKLSCIQHVPPVDHLFREFMNMGDEDAALICIQSFPVSDQGFQQGLLEGATQGYLSVVTKMLQTRPISDATRGQIISHKRVLQRPPVLSYVLQTGDVSSENLGAALSYATAVAAPYESVEMLLSGHHPISQKDLELALVGAHFDIRVVRAILGRLDSKAVSVETFKAALYTAARKDRHEVIDALFTYLSELGINMTPEDRGQIARNAAMYGHWDLLRKILQSGSISDGERAECVIEAIKKNAVGGIVFACSSGSISAEDKQRILNTMFPFGDWHRHYDLVCKHLGVDPRQGAKQQKVGQGPSNHEERKCLKA
ncbi:MAG: RING-H2 finger protein [Chlamydiales bacterium]